MWYLYWIAVFVTAVIIIAVQAFKKGCAVTDYLGMVVGQLISNNNWRWVALFVLAVVFSISAILAGFGRPLLFKSAKEAQADLIERVGSNNVVTITSQIDRLWRGTNSVSSAITKAKDKDTEKSYPGWGKWLWAFFLWITLVIYAPFAFADESKSALKKTLKLLERRNKQIKNSSPTTVAAVPSPSSASASASAPTGDVSLLRLLKVHVLASYVPEFTKLVAKKLNIFK